MKDEKILKKAIEKAVKNGWDVFGWGLGKIKEYKDNGVLVGDDSRPLLRDKFLHINAIIFNHDFAKALNFKLKDLGAWCDEGKGPLKFIEKLLD